MKIQSDDPTFEQISGYNRTETPTTTPTFDPDNLCACHQAIMDMCNEKARTAQEIADVCYGGYPDLTHYGVAALLDCGLLAFDGGRYHVLGKTP